MTTFWGRLILRWAPKVAAHIAGHVHRELENARAEEPLVRSIMPPRWGTDVYAMLQDGAPDLIEVAWEDFRRKHPYGHYATELQPALVAHAVRALIDTRARLRAEAEAVDADRLEVAAGACVPFPPGRVLTRQRSSP